MRSGDYSEAAVAVIFELTVAPEARRASQSQLSAPVKVPIGMAEFVMSGDCIEVAIAPADR